MGHNTTSLALQDAAYDEEPKSQARNLPLYVSPHPIEALEDLAQFAMRDADATIGDRNLDAPLARLRDLDANIHRRVRVLDRVFEQIRKHHHQLAGISPHLALALRLEALRIGGKPVAFQDVADALANHREQIDASLENHAPDLLGARSCQHLLDRCIEPVQIFSHTPEELGPLYGIGIVTTQGVEVEPERRQGRLHLVGHSVEEGMLALVESHLANQPQAHPHEPDHHDEEEERAQHQQQPVAHTERRRSVGTIGPYEHLPTHGQGQQQHDQHDANRQRRDRGTVRHWI